MTAADAYLRWMTRRLAGINPWQASEGERRSYVTPKEWADCHSGKAGPRACGPALWDNAVRAAEDG
jgi:hypothetical protein